MSTLADGQWQIDSGPVMGWWTPYPIARPTFDDLDVDTTEAARPRGDGRRFGRDFARGFTVTLDVAVSGTRDTVRGLYEQVAAHWRPRSVRLTPGAQSVLRYNFGGETRRLYGRGREFTPNVELAYQGVIKVTATFDTSHAGIYSDEEHHVRIPLVASSHGGLLVPAIAPFDLTNHATASHTVTVLGGQDAPMRLRINGPITDPMITAVDGWRVWLRGDIASDDWVELDARRGTALSRFGVNWAGAFTAASTPLPELVLAPGSYPFSLSGVDATGTASLDVFHRAVFSSF